MIKQECIGIPDMILLLMIFCFKKKIKAEIVLSPGGAYFLNKILHSRSTPKEGTPACVLASKLHDWDLRKSQK